MKINEVHGVSNLSLLSKDGIFNSRRLVFLYLINVSGCKGSKCLENDAKISVKTTNKDC